MLLKKEKKFYVVLAITLLFMFGFGQLPPIGEITQDGMKVLGIFLGLVFAWCFNEIIWASILSMLALTFMGYGSMSSNYNSLIGNANMGLILAAMLFVYTLESNGVMKEFAKFITSAKWARKDPWMLVAAFFLASFILSMFITTGVAVILILWTLFYEVCKDLDIKKHDLFATLVLIGIVIISGAASIIMPYSPTVLACMAIERASIPSLVINNLTYIGFNFIVAVVISLLIFLLCKYIIHPQINFELKQCEPYKMNLTKRRKVVLFYLGLLVLFMLVPPLLPDGMMIKTIFNNTLGSLGILILITVCMSITYIDGEALLDMQEGLKNGIAWPLFFLASAAFLVSGYLTNTEFGIIQTLSALVAPILGGRSAVFILIVSVATLVILTNLINDIVSISLLFPLCLQFYTAAGGEATLLGVLMIPAMIQGCFLPSGSMLGAILHGNTEWLTSKDTYKYVGIMEIIVLIVLSFASFVGFHMGIF